MARSLYESIQLQTEYETKKNNTSSDECNIPYFSGVMLCTFMIVFGLTCLAIMCIDANYLVNNGSTLSKDTVYYITVKLICLFVTGVISLTFGFGVGTRVIQENTK